MTFEVFWESLVTSFLGIEISVIAMAYILVPVALIWGATKVFLLMDNSSNVVFKRPYIIFKFFFIISNFVALTLGVVYIYFWKQKYYDSFNHYGVHVLSFLLVLVIAIWALIKKSNFSQKENVNKGEFIKIPLTIKETSVIYSIAKSDFNKLKLFALVPAFSFLTLFLYNNDKYNLVSFTLDTSSSMTSGVYGFSNDFPPIEIGKEALSKTISGFDDFTDVVISTFEESSNYKSDINSIVSVSNSEMLAGQNIFFSASEKNATLNYVNTLGDNVTNTSPLCETIFSNFLYTKGIVESGFSKKNYENIIAIVITDGEGNLQNDVRGFLCENYDFDEFYNPQNINIINLNEGGSSNDFWNLSIECDYLTWSGYDADQFNNSFAEIFKNYRNNWFFLLTLGIIYISYLFIVLITFPKRL